MSSSVDADLRYCLSRYRNRCLLKGVQWVCDLLQAREDCSIKLEYNHNKNDESNIEDPPPPPMMHNYLNEILPNEYTRIKMAQTLILQNKYLQASHYVSMLTSDLAHFLYVYSLYMDYERRKWECYLREDGHIRFNSSIEKEKLERLLEVLNGISNPDGYVLYIHALVYKEMNSINMCEKLLIKSLKSEPLNWVAWKDLARTVSTCEKLINLKFMLPDCWMKSFFVIEASVNVGFYLEKEIKASYEEITSSGLSNSTCSNLMLAQLYHLCCDIDKAKSIFDLIRTRNPYHLECIDLYSNILISKQDMKSLSKLVQELFEHSKYKPETYFAAGNLYSAVGNHEKSAYYFQQATKLNPNWSHAWTLLGHEYIELKDLASAVVSYRKALDMNPNEYRAWYGLGLIYEILKESNEAFGMFERALSHRPNDTRILYAVATTSLKVKHENRAIWALRRCIEIGDNEYNAVYTLATLLINKDKNEAASLFCQYLRSYDEMGLNREDEEATATVFLMNYYYETKQYATSELYARRATKYNHCLNDAEYLLNILNKVSIKNKPLIPSVNESIVSCPDENTDDAMDLS